GVSQPEFNPIWHCVFEQEGEMVDLFEEAAKLNCRQEVPVVYRINGLLYIWRTEFMRKTHENWRGNGRHMIHEIPELRAISIDDLQEFRRAEALVNEGLISFPWITKEQVQR
ncbi:MAG: acylneuraminate cytidylyltransferase family protein, partial [Verrucomicrobiota bacterium]|nr:acylneuraminate cytidylyltransferase family protein [Verrucomicrobiota bacterium]